MMNQKGFPSLKKESCEACQKQINIGQRAIVCYHCDIICHVKCAKNQKFVPFRQNLYCQTCLASNDIIRYNPYHEIISSHSEESDKFYETESSEFI